jgi:hypothetical protein
MKVTLKQLLLIIKKQVSDVKTITERMLASYPVNVDSEENYLKINNYDFRELYLQRTAEKAKLVALKEIQIMNSAVQQVLLMQMSEMKDEIATLQKIRIPLKMYSSSERVSVDGHMELRSIQKQSWYPEVNGQVIDQRWVDMKIAELQDSIRAAQARIESMNLETQVQILD